MRVLWSLQHWAQAVAELQTTGALPQRIALVPNARVAHALRRELIETASAGTLIGTRFLTLLQLASEVLLDAGEPHLPNDRELGPTFVREAFDTTQFKRFDHNDLVTLPGWDIAFTRTIADLDAVQLSPSACLSSSDTHVSDVGRVHEILRARSDLRTIGGILARAATLASSWKDQPATLAVITGFESPAELALLRALPSVTLAAWAVRPRRTAHAKRMQELVGADTADADPQSLIPAAPATTLHHLQIRLFEDNATTPAPIDNSVTIALYAGVHEEVEAAASWVVEQILEHGVAAQDIAIFSPIAEPYGSLLRARLAALPWAEPSTATFSERGIPLTERPDGTRLLLAVRALQQGLSRDSLAPLLPLLRPSDEDCRVRGLAHAWELLNTVAAIGGGQSNLEAGSIWPQAWSNALKRLTSAPLQSAGLEERELQRRAELQSVLASLAAAVEALAGTLAAVVANEPLNLLWTRIMDFVDAHLKLPPSIPPVTAVLSQACRQFQGHETREPTGVDALSWLDETLCSSVLRSARYGMPAVYLGTLAGARGLRFRAVRIVGLVEGSVPSAVREDPVLPDAARAALSPFLLSSRQRAHMQLTWFDDAVRSASERLSLTAPRVSLEGSTRQPAAVLLDVMRALSGSN
ncbi:MAG TPA: hypothetical protein VFG30_36710, partial [Polyangiales bacterium]|nr:hypothetical protein [Polyangiales bacterium]